MLAICMRDVRKILLMRVDFFKSTLSVFLLSHTAWVYSALQCLIPSHKKHYRPINMQKHKRINKYIKNAQNSVVCSITIKYLTLARRKVNFSVNARNIMHWNCCHQDSVKRIFITATWRLTVGVSAHTQPIQINYNVADKPGTSTHDKRLLGDFA